jgi:hypothetical protein
MAEEAQGVEAAVGSEAVDDAMMMRRIRAQEARHRAEGYIQKYSDPDFWDREHRKQRARLGRQRAERTLFEIELRQSREAVQRRRARAPELIYKTRDPEQIAADRQRLKAEHERVTKKARELLRDHKRSDLIYKTRYEPPMTNNEPPTVTTAADPVKRMSSTEQAPWDAWAKAIAYIEVEKAIAEYDKAVDEGVADLVEALNERFDRRKAHFEKRDDDLQTRINALEEQVSSLQAEIRWLRDDAGVINFDTAKTAVRYRYAG